MPKKLTFEFVKDEFIRLKGYELLETEYINNSTPMRYRCPHHPNEETYITYNSLRTGHGCDFCGGTVKFTFEFVYGEFEKVGYKLLETEYIDSRTSMRYQCPFHPNEELKISYHALKNGQRCKLCYLNNPKLTNKQYAEKIKNKNLIPLEQYIDTNTNIKHLCLICNYEFYDNPHHIGAKNWKCDSCFPNNLAVVVGINDMWTTNPDLAKLLVNSEDGYKYSYGSEKRVDFKCPDCGNIIKDKSIKKINDRGLSCPICADGISYPQKLVANVLKELNINFDTEQFFDWCIFKLKNKDYRGRYDFVFKLDNQNYIVEADGGLGHGKKLHYKSNKTHEDNIYIDRMKDVLAKENNYEMIRINCEPSDLDFIKNNILNSKLNNLFDLSSVDWEICHKNSLKSKVIEACDLWNSGIKSTTKICKILKLHSSTIISYLKKCAEIGLCDYVPKPGISSRKSIMKKVKCINTNEIFNSIKEASLQYNINGISACCRKVCKSAGIHPVTGEKLIWEFCE